MSAEWWGGDIVPRIRWKLVVDRVRRYNHEDDRIPDGYGIAYYRDDKPSMVCYPVPINLIVGVARSLWWHIMCPPWRFTEYKLGMGMRAKATAWDEGFDAGVNQQKYGRIGLGVTNPHRSK